MPPSSAAETRARILSAAAAEILAVGYTNASLSSIAARLGVTKGALGYHFPSKSSVAYALFDHMTEAYAHLEASIRADDLRGVRALVAMLARTGVRNRTDPMFAAASAVVTLSVASGLDLPPTLSYLADTFSGYIREAKEDGEISADVDDVTAGEDILAGSIGTLLLLTRHPERQDDVPFRLTRRQLRAIGVIDVDRIVDEMIARSLATVPRYDVPRPDQAS